MNAFECQEIRRLFTNRLYLTRPSMLKLKLLQKSFKVGKQKKKKKKKNQSTYIFKVFKIKQNEN